jgi:hypothetical protein
MAVDSAPTATVTISIMGAIIGVIITAITILDINRADTNTGSI